MPHVDNSVTSLRTCVHVTDHCSHQPSACRHGHINATTKWRRWQQRLDAGSPPGGAAEPAGHEPGLAGGEQDQPHRQLLAAEHDAGRHTHALLQHRRDRELQAHQGQNDRCVCRVCDVSALAICSCCVI